MVWVFWGLLATLLGGMFVLAVLARRKRSPLRPAGPSTIQVLQAAGQTFGDLLWTMSHPFGRGGSHRYDSDPSKDYVRDHERELQGRRSDRSDQG